MKTDIGILPANSKQVVLILNKILSDEFTLYVKTLNFHWNVVASNFGELHAFFERQYEELLEISDTVAERARSVGGRSYGSLKEFLDNTSLKENTSALSAQNMIAQLLKDHETIIKELRKYIDSTANEYHDAGTSNFLTDLMEKHEKMAWMLRSFLD